MSESAPTPSRQGQITFLTLAWPLTLLLAYGAARSWSAQQTPPVPSEPGVDRGAPSVVEAGEVAIAEPPPLAAAVVDWSAYRPDVGLGPDFNDARRFLIQEILADANYDYRQYIETFVETLPPEHYPKLFAELSARPASDVKAAFLAELIGTWAKQDWLSAEAAMGSLPVFEQHKPAVAMANALAERTSATDGLAWLLAHGSPFAYPAYQFAEAHMDDHSDLATQIRWLELIREGGTQAHREASTFLVSSMLEQAVTPEAMVALYEHLPFEPTDEMKMMFLSSIAWNEGMIQAEAMVELLGNPRLQEEARQLFSRIAERRKNTGDDEIIELTPFELPPTPPE